MINIFNRGDKMKVTKQNYEKYKYLNAQFNVRKKEEKSDET